MFEKILWLLPIEQPCCTTHVRNLQKRKLGRWLDQELHDVMEKIIISCPIIVDWHIMAPSWCFCCAPTKRVRRHMRLASFNYHTRQAIANRNWCLQSIVIVGDATQNQQVLVRKLSRKPEFQISWHQKNQNRASLRFIEKYKKLLYALIAIFFVFKLGSMEFLSGERSRRLPLRLPTRTRPTS